MDYDHARHMMVEAQIRTNKITDQRVIDAMGEVPRELFVPDAVASLAYVDEALDIGGGRYLVEPLVLAYFLQFAAIGEGDMVLEVGCGTGYSTAILAKLAHTVVAIEQSADLVKTATDNLVSLGVDNAAVIEAPLNTGYEKQSPYDVIILNGAVSHVPDCFESQLSSGGRLLTIILPGSPSGSSLGKGIKLQKLVDSLAEEEIFDAGSPILPGFEAEAAFAF